MVWYHQAELTFGYGFRGMDYGMNCWNSGIRDRGISGEMMELGSSGFRELLMELLYRQRLSLYNK